MFLLTLNICYHQCQCSADTVVVVLVEVEVLWCVIGDIEYDPPTTGPMLSCPVSCLMSINNVVNVQLIRRQRFEFECNCLDFVTLEFKEEICIKLTQRSIFLDDF